MCENAASVVSFGDLENNEMQPGKNLHLQDTFYHKMDFDS